MGSFCGTICLDSSNRLSAIEVESRWRRGFSRFQCVSLVFLEHEGAHFASDTGLAGGQARSALGPIVNDGTVFCGDVRVDDRGGSSNSGEFRQVNGHNDLEHFAGNFAAVGASYLAQFSGDYSIAIWDSRKGVCKLLRSPLGMSPLFYAQTGGLLWFASNLHALVTAVGGGSRMDRGRVFSLLQGIDLHSGRTVHEGFSCVRGGYSIAISKRSPIQEERVWRPHDVPGRPEQSFARTVSDFRDLFNRAVEDRIGRGVGVGAELSGGLDSAAVVCGAKSFLGITLPTYSIGFSQVPESDESQYIRDVVEWTGSRNLMMDGGDLDPIEGFERSLDWYGGLHFAGNIYANVALLERMSADGLRVLTNGVDGDNIARHGLGLISELAEAGRWNDATCEIKRVKDIFSLHFGDPGAYLFHGHISPALGRLGSGGAVLDFLRACWAVKGSYGGSMWKLVRRHLLNRSALQHRGLWLRGVAPAAKIWSGFFPAEWYSDDFRTLGAVELSHRVEVAQQYSERGSFEEMLMGGVNDLYGELQSSLALGVGVQSVSPFMDMRLVCFGLGVPSEYLLRDGVTRAVLREAFREAWPLSLRARRAKGSLFPSFRSWFRRVVPSRLRMMLSETPELVSDVFNLKTVGSSLDALESGHIAGSGIINRLWIVFAIGLWRKRTGAL